MWLCECRSVSVGVFGSAWECGRAVVSGCVGVRVCGCWSECIGVGMCGCLWVSEYGSVCECVSVCVCARVSVGVAV